MIRADFQRKPFVMRRYLIIAGVIVLLVLTVVALTDDESQNYGPIIRAIGQLLRAF
jgi:hypothetical protein